MRRRAALVIALAGALVAPACGGDETSGTFDDAVAEVRDAVEDGDAERATSALDGLALQALAAHDEGAIDDDEVSEIAELIASSKALVGEVVSAESTSSGDIATTTTTSTTTTTEAVFEEVYEDGEDDEDEDEDKEEGKGEGEGKGKKDD